MRLSVQVYIRFLAASLFIPLFYSHASAQETGDEYREEVLVWGRGIEMMGNADSASHGIVGHADFSTRPMLRVGELVEVVPGMIATQHSGPGKANQYFLRGMNLDHGSDFAGYFEGMPVNFRSHAHAAGYLDLNFMIPEIIETVEFHKGPYYAELGDYSAAGAAYFRTYDYLERGFIEGIAGSEDYYRLVGGNSHELGAGNLLYAGEVLFRDGPWELPQDLEKYNAVIKYTGILHGIESRLMATFYTSSWNSTDQIPLREVERGNLTRFGFIDPALGGKSTRINFISNFMLKNTDIKLYATRYKLNLFSNPTYYLIDPVNSDQIEQEDNRWVLGGSVRYERESSWFQRYIDTRFGADLRYDDVNELNLFNTTGYRRRIGVAREDEVVETSLGLFGEAEILWNNNLRTTLGLRADFYDWDVHARINANSGSGSDYVISPKFALAWILAEDYEVYANYGQGFHSNDVRGAEIEVDPVSKLPADTVDVLVKAQGAELGIRSEILDGLKLTLAGFWMDLDSELLFVGDAGTSQPNEATRRFGVEFSGFWEVKDWLVLDATAAWTRARFRNAPPGQDHIPDAHKTVFGAGITIVHPGGFTGSLRMRHFGDAPLTEDASVHKGSTTLLNLGLSYEMTEHVEIGVDVLNLLDNKGDDIEFYFESRLKNEPSPVEDFHFHPVESIAARASIRYKF